MQATYKLDKFKVATLPLTLSFTATVEEWRELADALEKAEAHRKAEGLHPDPIRPVTECIRNLMKAIDDATGYGYKTRGYSYEYEVVTTTTEEA